MTDPTPTIKKWGYQMNFTREQILGLYPEGDLEPLAPRWVQRLWWYRGRVMWAIYQWVELQLHRHPWFHPAWVEQEADYTEFSVKSRWVRDH